MNDSWISWALDSANWLSSSDTGIFVARCLVLAGKAAGIAIAAMAVRMFTSKNPLHIAVVTFIRIALVLWMLHNYNQFVNLVTNEGVSMSQQIEGGGYDSVQGRLDALAEKATTGGGVAGWIRFGFLTLTTALAQGALFLVVSWGFIAQSILKMVGAYFVLAFIFQWSERFFWAWLACLLQYSFYPVFANAFVLVMANYFTRFFGAHPLPWPANQAAALSLFVLAMAMSFVFGMFMVIGLVSHAFTGGSGDHPFSRLIVLR